jgi:hypothetical protein
VRPLTSLTKRVRHAEAGLLTFNCTHLWLGRRSESRLTTMVPADDVTRLALIAARHW